MISVVFLFYFVGGVVVIIDAHQSMIHFSNVKVLTGHQDYSSLPGGGESHLSAFLFSVFAGRWLMSFWTGTAKIHELYTAACGLYVCWLTIRAVTVLLAWMPQGRRVIFQKVKEWSLMVSCYRILVLPEEE